MNYFKLLFFYTISIIDAIINFVCALVGYYPALELSQDYLLSKEMLRVEGEIADRTYKREVASAEADALVAKALDQHQIIPKYDPKGGA